PPPVRRRAVGHERGLAGAQARRAAAQRTEERDAVGRAAPVPLGRDDVDVRDLVERVGQRTDRVAVDPVVVRDEDALASRYLAASTGASSMSSAASVRARRPEFTSTA